MQLFLILASTLVISAISLIGAITLAIKDRFLKIALLSFVSFSAGSLLGGAFLHLIPEAIEQSNPGKVFNLVIAGFTLFFLLEKYLHWRHCHEGNCDLHSFTYLNLVGDAAHNFLDGLVIAASFLTSTHLGFITTLLIIAHEIPQELSDFAVLIYGGFSKKKALICNFLVALTAFAGALIGYFLGAKVSGFSCVLLSVTAGGFIYIASSDLVPEIHKENSLKKSSLSLVFFLTGIIVMYLLKKIS